MTSIFRARVIPKFPTAVDGSGGIKVTKVNGVYIIETDFDQFGSAPGTILQRGLTTWEGLAPGPTGTVLTRGAPGQPNLWEISAASVAYNDRQVFLSSGSFLKSSLPTGVLRIKVEVVGGGGGGGGGDTSTSARGSGGGGGGCSIEWIDVSALAASETVTVGLGGAGGTSSATPTNGSPGGNSTFGTTPFLTGGGGGGGFAATGSAVGGGPAGLGSGGEINIPGGPGQSNLDGTVTSGSGGGQGGGAYGGASNVDTSQIPGTNFGGGAACGNNLGTGDGAPGIVVVTW